MKEKLKRFHATLVAAVHHAEDKWRKTKDVDEPFVQQRKFTVVLTSHAILKEFYREFPEFANNAPDQKETSN